MKTYDWDRTGDGKLDEKRYSRRAKPKKLGNYVLKRSQAYALRQWVARVPKGTRFTIPELQALLDRDKDCVKNCMRRLKKDRCVRRVASFRPASNGAKLCAARVWETTGKRPDGV
jgi:hypothetical protein